MELPPGFRFHPTDEELITHYLSHKVLDKCFSARAIGEVELNKCEPWDLPWMARMGGEEWYFFCLRDKKYPSSWRTNRATDAGYWKVTGKDKEIYNRGKAVIGMKKTLVFHTGKPPHAQKTSWIMHEYRLHPTLSNQNLPLSAQNEWVICRFFEKSEGRKKVRIVPSLLRVNSINNVQEDPPSPLKMDLSFPTQTDQTPISATSSNPLTVFPSSSTNDKNQQAEFSVSSLLYHNGMVHNAPFQNQLYYSSSPPPPAYDDIGCLWNF